MCDQAARFARPGTLDWLQLQEHVEVLGVELPVTHRVQPGSTLAASGDGTSCRLIRPDGRRCGAVATRRYGLCIVHLGGGGQDIKAMAHAGGQAQTRLKLRRQLLGVGPRTTGTPRAIARLAAHERAEEVAAALLAPLDDDELSSLARQRAAAVILGETDPLQASTVELELPADPAGVQALGWSELQQLAGQLLGHSRDTEPAIAVVEPNEG